MKRLIKEVGWFGIIFILALLIILSPGFIILVTNNNKNFVETPVVNVQLPESPVSYSEITELINVKRAQNGKRPALMINNTLNMSAQLKANDMILGNYWDHNSPTGEEPWKFFDRVGYKYKKAGENLAKCYTTAESVVNAWYDSPAHKENILGDYKEVGYGVGTFSDGCLLIVNHFAAY